jgi:hypothetical protein
MIICLRSVDTFGPWGRRIGSARVILLFVVQRLGVQDDEAVVCSVGSVPSGGNGTMCYSMSGKEIVRGKITTSGRK